MPIRVVETAAACREALRWAGPPAARRAGAHHGALQPGTVSLMTRARAECGTVAVSIFVKPAAVRRPDDIAPLPRTWNGSGRVRKAGVDVVFVPSVAEMYPAGRLRWPLPCRLRGVSEGWEGRQRPGHFDGVATVVAKLFSIAGPCRAYFGEGLPAAGCGTPDGGGSLLPVTVTAADCAGADGLGSRAATSAFRGGERRAAVVLSRALVAGRSLLEQGADYSSTVAEAMRRAVEEEPLVPPRLRGGGGAHDLVARGDHRGPAAVRLLTPPMSARCA